MLLLLAAQWCALEAQVERTEITGAVTDAQGSRVPQAKVRASQATTGLVRESQTTSQGTYDLPNLPPGTYTLQFLKAGFSSFTVEQVRQSVGQTRTLNVRLDLAQSKAQTTVTEPLIQLDKVDATVGTAIEHAQVDNLPINGRNWAPPDIACARRH